MESETSEASSLKHEQRREITRLLFGYEFRSVHSWLDETYEKPKDASYHEHNHWLARHHVDAINKQYSDQIQRGAAYLHVVSDIANIWRDWFLPKNETEQWTYLTKRDIKLKPKTNL